MDSVRSVAESEVADCEEGGGQHGVPRWEAAGGLRLVHRRARHRHQQQSDQLETLLQQSHRLLQGVSALQ